MKDSKLLATSNETPRVESGELLSMKNLTRLNSLKRFDINNQ